LDGKTVAATGVKIDGHRPRLPRAPQATDTIELIVNSRLLSAVDMTTSRFGNRPIMDTTAKPVDKKLAATPLLPSLGVRTGSSRA
jgi:hypothetical protein